MGTGGYRLGAGRPGWHRKTSAMYRVDVRHLAHDGLLRAVRAFGWEWKDDDGKPVASIRIQVELGGVRFQYHQGEHEVDDLARVVTTACTYGGVRHWFSCPCCGRRCAILYMGKRVACRKCYRLQYPSQSDDVTGNLWRKKRKIAARIGSDGTDWAWTQKPKGMHQATFQRIRGELSDLDVQLDAWLCWAAARRIGYSQIKGGR